MRTRNELKTLENGLGGRDRLEFGTVRPKGAEVLTAKMTANIPNLGGRGRTNAEYGRLVPISDGRWRTLADAGPAVFKTACGLEKTKAYARSRPYICGT